MTVLPPPVVPVTKDIMNEPWYRYFHEKGTSVDSQISTLQSQVAGITYPWTIVAKTSDETRNSTIVLTNDSALTFPVAASTKYRFRIAIFYLTGTTPDFQWQLTGPTSPTAVHYVSYTVTDGDAFNPRGRTVFSSVMSETSASATSGSIMITGILQNGVNAGNVTLQWAQNTSDPGNTTVQGASFIEYATV